MIKEIPKSNRSLRPFKVHKDWEFTESSSGSISVYNIQDGVGGSFDPETADTTNGVFTYPLYKSIEHLYYTNQDVGGVDKLGDRRNRVSEFERVLEDTGIVINIPPDIFGETVKRNSVFIEDTFTGNRYMDDGYSNIIPVEFTVFDLIEVDFGSGIIEFSDAETTFTGTIVEVDPQNGNFELETIYGTSNTTGLIIDSINGQSIQETFILIDNNTSTVIFEGVISSLGGIPVFQIPIGNVFYGHGLIVLSQIEDIEASFVNFTLEFQSTVTIYEHEYFLEVGEGEFNISQNPTAITFDDGVPFVKQHFTGSISGSVTGSFSDYDRKSITDPTGSYLAPYITTIALYDDNLNMLATAKLAKPIKNLPDYPVNFIVRFDT